MLLALDDFIFELKTLPFGKKSQERHYRWAQQLPVANRPIYQYMGEGERTMKLSGVLYPELTGGPLNLNQLDELAKRGEALQMQDGNGFPHGFWLIDSISDVESDFFEDGTPRKIEFDISLRFDRPQYRTYVGNGTADSNSFESVA